jgi:hypothetical protein
LIKNARNVIYCGDNLDYSFSIFDHDLARHNYSIFQCRYVIPSGPRGMFVSIQYLLESCLEETFQNPHNLHQRHVVDQLEGGTLHSAVNQTTASRHMPPNPFLSNDRVTNSNPDLELGDPEAPEPNDTAGEANANRRNPDPGLESVSGLFGQILGQNPELQGMVSAMEAYVPFVIMLTVKLLFDHVIGIFVFGCLVTTSFHANSVVKQQVSRQDRRNVWALLAVMVNLIACIVFIYFVFQDEKLYNRYDISQSI